MSNKNVVSSGNTFTRIYKAVQLVPKGKVTTYGDIANYLGLNDVRVVGWALNKNPDPSTIPCHRVVTKQGRVSKAFAFGGENEQVFLLKNEGVGFKSDFEVDMENYSFRFSLG